jgi:sulfite exporter TauE/SafE
MFLKRRSVSALMDARRSLVFTGFGIVAGFILAVLVGTSPIVPDLVKAGSALVARDAGLDVPGFWVMIAIAILAGVSNVSNERSLPLLYSLSLFIGKKGWLERVLGYSFAFIAGATVVGFAAGLAGRAVFSVPGLSSPAGIAAMAFAFLGLVVFVFGVSEFGLYDLPFMKKFSGRVSSLSDFVRIALRDSTGLFGVGPVRTYSSLIFLAIVVASPLFGAALLLAHAIGRTLPILWAGFVKPDLLQVFAQILDRNQERAAAVRGFMLTFFGVFLLVFWTVFVS